MADDCVFCKGAPNNERLTQSSRFLALLDGHPVSRGHTLIVPRWHVVSLFELGSDGMAEAYSLLRQARALVDAAHRPDGYNIGINDGAAAGRTVHHLHIHLIPRYLGDVPDPRGGVRNILPGPSPDLWSARPAVLHAYLSTGCLHGDHAYCQSAGAANPDLTAEEGRKRPAECKFCAAPCVCPCHRSDPRSRP